MRRDGQKFKGYLPQILLGPFLNYYVPFVISVSVNVEDTKSIRITVYGLFEFLQDVTSLQQQLLVAKY